MYFNTRQQNTLVTFGDMSTFRLVPPHLAEVPFKVAFSHYLQFPMVPPAKLPSQTIFKITFLISFEQKHVDLDALSKGLTQNILISTH